jgi:hypothetical protein
MTPEYNIDTIIGRNPNPAQAAYAGDVRNVCQVTNWQHLVESKANGAMLHRSAPPFQAGCAPINRLLTGRPCKFLVRFPSASLSCSIVRQLDIPIVAPAFPHAF